MSEHISIQEGGQSRNFGNVELLETETIDGTGSCFWVPENARELESDYFIENGDYTPEKYAYSDVTVRVMEPFDDLEIGFVPDPEIPDIPIPHIEEIPDPISPVPPIDLTIDPDTGLPKVKIDGVDIDLPDISADIDINGDLDISLDLENNELDISGLNMDGLDVNLSIDLGTLDIDVTDLPDEIRIMHVPTKTAYKDGEEIDLDGLVVQAFRNGEVWNDESGKYIDGYIPAHKLFVDPTTAFYRADGMKYNIDSGFFCHMSTNYYDRTFTKTSIEQAFAGLIIDDSGWNNPIIISDNQKAIRWHCEDVKSPIFTRDFGPTGETTIRGLKVYYGRTYGLKEGESGTGLVSSGIYTFHGTTQELLNEIVYGAPGILEIKVSWPRPKDNKLLTASFDISVEESEGGVDSSGTHYSGKFDESSSGHWDGTTPSGEYGGSHHSGKF